MNETPRRIGPPVPGETDAERDERERNNRAEYIEAIAIGEPPYDDEDDTLTTFVPAGNTSS